MASVSVSIDTSGFKQRYTRYVEDLKAALESNWESVAVECLKDISSRTPAPEVEYAYIQGYEGGVFSGEGEHPVISSNGERISFIRKPGQWLSELVMSPTTWTSNPGALSLSLGHLAALESGSTFGWQNYNKKDGAILHTSEYGVFPWFEYGFTATQKPAFGSQKYKLKPYGDDGAQYWTSQKTYPRMGMYSGFQTETFRLSVYKIAKEVKF